MKNILITNQGEDYITVSYFDENDQEKEVDITGAAIEIIEILCGALKKPFPKDYVTQAEQRKENGEE